MKSLHSLQIFSDSKSIDVSFLLKKKLKCTIQNKVDELMMQLVKEDIIVLVKADYKNICKILELSQSSRKFNPIIAFVSNLKSEEISRMIRCGAFAVYNQNRFSELVQIIEKEKLDLINFSKEKEQSVYISLITDNVNELVFEFDSDSESEKKWRLNFIGGQVEQLAGVTAENCLKNQDLWWNMIHPDDVPNIIETTRVAVKELKPQTRDYRIKHAIIGKYFWLQDTVTPVHDSWGKVTRLYGVARSIHKAKITENELVSEKKFNDNILATAPGILYVLDYKTQLLIKGLNRFADFLGYSNAEIEKLPNGVYSLIHNKDLALVREQEKELSDAKEGVVVPVEFRLKHKSGKFIWVRVYSKIFERNKKGKPIKEIGAVLDITREKESETLFKKMALNTNLGIAIIQDEKIKFANPGASYLLEYSNAELVESSVFNFIAPGRTALTHEVFSGLYQNKFNVKQSDQLLLTKSGKKLEVNITSSLISYRGRKAIMSVFLDDSVLKKAERTFRTLFNTSEDLIYILNEKNEFIDVNDSVTDKYGYSVSEIIGRTPDFLGDSTKNNMPLVLKKIEKAWQGEITRFDWWSKKKNGDTFPKEVILKKGQYFGEKVLVATGRDMTKRQVAEEEKTKLIHQLLEQNRDLEQFAYIISHNMRSPVASILGLTQIFEADELSDENKELLNLITQSANALDDVIQDLNKTLTIRKHQSELKEVFDFNIVSESAKLSLASAISSTQTKIIENFDNKLKVKTIKSYLQNIIYNLLSNAIKYRKKNSNPKIELKVEIINNTIRIEVKDNGLGMDLKKLKNKLFGLYERFHYHVDGKGLGLYLVKQQTDALGGKISVESEVGKGSLFIVEIPND